MSGAAESEMSIVLLDSAVPKQPLITLSWDLHPGSCFGILGKKFFFFFFFYIIIFWGTTMGYLGVFFNFWVLLIPKKQLRLCFFARVPSSVRLRLLLQHSSLHP